MFDFIMKYSTEWPIRHNGNNDGCRFMIINGKFLCLGIAYTAMTPQDHGTTEPWYHSDKEHL